MRRRGGIATEVRRVGLVIAMLAAALLVASVFMPKLYCPTIHLRNNRLIDGWEGMALLGCSATVVIGSVSGLSWRHLAWLVWLAGATALGVVVYASTGSRLLVEEAVPGVAGSVYAEQAIGLVVAGLAALATIGAALPLGLKVPGSRPQTGR